MACEWLLVGLLFGIRLTKMGSARYPPIADHGVIGNLHTVAQISTEGTVDWYCSPRFDSPSLFASLLDAERGGHFRIRPSRTEWQTKQLYFPDTNVLITRFLTPDGVGEVKDFMPVNGVRGGSHGDRLIRRVLGVRRGQPRPPTWLRVTAPATAPLG